MAISRLNRIAEKKSRQQGLFYLILSILFILAMVKWGVPGFIQLITFVTDSGSGRPVSSGLKIPPQTPALTPIAEATFSSTIKVSGIAQPGVAVKLISNGQTKDEQDADIDGNFAFNSVSLLEGKNIIGVQSVNKDGLESNIAQAEVFFDNERPGLELTSPEDEAEFNGSAQRTVEIVGSMGEKGGVTINGNFVSVSASGDFSYRFPLEPGLNEITIVAADRAGNQATRLLRLHFTE